MTATVFAVSFPLTFDNNAVVSAIAVVAVTVSVGVAVDVDVVTDNFGVSKVVVDVCRQSCCVVVCVGNTITV